MAISARTILKWSPMLVLDFLLAAVICEIWIRLFIPTTNICYTVDETLGVLFCPNQETYGYVEGDYANVFLTNSKGFHDYEYEEQKPQGVYRIHMYGDSMVQGKALQIEDTVTQVVQKYLNSQGYPFRFEVMNMASGDDSTSCQILTYQKIGKAYDPDLVLCYFSDDFGDNIFEVNGVTYSPYHKLTQDGGIEFVPPIPKDTTTPWEKFKRTSRLYRLYANKLFESKFYHNVNTLKNNFILFVATFNNDNQVKESGSASYKQRVKDLCTEKSWPLTLALLSYFSEITSRDNTPFVLLDGLKFNPNFVGETYSNDDLKQFCGQNNIPYLSVYPKHEELRALRHEKAFFFQDNHPTKSGNKEISLYLAEKVNNYLKNSIRKGKNELYQN